MTRNIPLGLDLVPIIFRGKRTSIHLKYEPNGEGSGNPDLSEFGYSEDFTAEAALVFNHPVRLYSLGDVALYSPPKDKTNPIEVVVVGFPVVSWSNAIIAKPNGSDGADLLAEVSLGDLEPLYSESPDHSAEDSLEPQNDDRIVQILLDSSES